MWGMSKPSSRKVRTGPTFGHPSATLQTGMREWLAALPEGRKLASAAFDTRLNKPKWLTGSAASSDQQGVEPARVCGGDAVHELSRRSQRRAFGARGGEKARRWGEQLLTKVGTG